MEQFPMTKTGFETLAEELKNLKSVQRPAVIQDIATAREHGDLKENAEYHAARDQQSFIEGRIQELEAVTGKVLIIEPHTLEGDTIKFGATITIVDEDTDEEETWQIVGHHEADTEKKKISIQAPLSRGLIGKSLGDSVEITTPKGKRSYEILLVVFQ